MPKLSIVTINLNNKAGLQKTIESVFTQTFTDYEYIIIDGGSTDGSKELIENNANKFVYWVSEKDKGIFNAMNMGIKVADGDYLIFMNSGDYFFSEAVLQNVFVNGYEEDILYGNVKWWPIDYNGVYPDLLTFEHFIHNTIPHQGAFIKRKLFDVVGLYDEDYTVNSDWIFFILAVYKYNYSYRHLSIIISYCNTDGISLTKEGSLETQRIRLEFIEKHFKAFNEDLQNLKHQLVAAKMQSGLLKYRLVKYAIAIHNHVRKVQRIFYR